MVGIIHLNKEKNKTSHDCVHAIRKLLQLKKVGHSGTLDPQAQGVLNIYLGFATGFIDFVKSPMKTYAAEFQLGYTSDTLDRWGHVTKVPVGEITEEDVREAVNFFLQDYDQLPPMVSALKHKGKPLYAYAREGIEIERKKRRIFIKNNYSLVFHKSNLYGKINITCSKGTYVRSFIDDVASKLGTRGIMTELTRVENDYVHLDHTFTLGEIESMAKKADFSFISPIDAYLPFERIVLEEKDYLNLYHGRNKTIKVGYYGDTIILDYNGFQGVATWNGENYTKERLIP